MVTRVRVHKKCTGSFDPTRSVSLSRKGKHTYLMIYLSTLQKKEKKNTKNCIRQMPGRYQYLKDVPIKQAKMSLWLPFVFADQI